MPAAPKGRPCPALQSTITAAECGAKRLSEIQCPLSCRHNPYHPQNTERLGKLVEDVSEQLRARLAKSMNYEVLQTLLAATDAVPPDMIPWVVLCRAWEHRDASGRGLMQRWKADQWLDLTNDERVLLESLWVAQPRMLEIHGTSEDGITIAVDLLDADAPELVISGAMLACGPLPRFSPVLALVYSVPAATRLYGPVLALPRVSARQSASAFVQELLAHAKAPEAPEARQRWLIKYLTDTAFWEQLLATAPSIVAAQEVELADPPVLNNALADAALPELDGHTLRSALTDEVLRPRAITALKHWIWETDQDGDHDGEADCARLISLLELHEFAFPSPVVLASDDEDAELPAPDAGELADQAEEQLPWHVRQPPPKQAKLRVDDVEERLSWIAKQPAPKRPPVETLQRFWPELADTLREAAGAMLEPALVEALMEQAAAGARLLHLQGREASTKLTSEEQRMRMRYLIAQSLQSLEENLANEQFNVGTVVEWVQHHTQPKVMAHVAGRLTETYHRLSLGLDDDQLFNAIALLKAAMTELCYEEG